MQILFVINAGLKKAITRSIPSEEYEKQLVNISKLSADEARFNLATHVMSNGVELIIASDKIKHTEQQEYNNGSAASKHGQQKPVTLAPSTLKNQMLLALPSAKRENFTIPFDDNQFITKNCLTTYTYRTTYIENGTATVESREKVVSNRHTEERNYLKRTTQLPIGVTLSNTPDLVKGVFPTTYHYYNTLAGNDFVLTSSYTIINTITGPVDYISFLQPSEEATPLLETNTYYSRLPLTKSTQDGKDATQRVVLNENMLTQVVITESLPARSSMRSSKMRISATSKTKNKTELNVHVYATKTILTTLKYASSTTVPTKQDANQQHDQGQAQDSNEIQTRIIKTIISDVVPTTLLKPKLVSLFRNSNRKVLVTLATLADGETLQVTAVNLAEADSRIPNLDNSLLTNFIQPTAVTNNNNILMKTKKVDDNHFAESENKVVYSKPVKEPTASAATVNQLIGSLNLQRFQPMFNVMADLLQKNMLNKQTSQLKQQGIVQPVATLKPDTVNKKNPLYIPLQDGSTLFNDYKPDYNISPANEFHSNLGRLTAHSLHIQPPLANLSDLVIDQHTNIPISQQNLVLGNGIPIRPGEIINANANLIIGRPNGIVGQFFQSTNSDQSWEEYKNRSVNISKKKTFQPNIQLELMPPRVIPLGGASYYDQERIRGAYYEQERMPANPMAVNMYNNILKPPKSYTNYSSISTLYIRETPPAAALPIKSPLSPIHTKTALKPPAPLYMNNYYNQLYSSPPMDPPPVVYTETPLGYSLAPLSTALAENSVPLLDPPPAPLFKSGAYNQQYSSAASANFPETSLGSHMDPPLMNLNEAELRPPALSNIPGYYNQLYSSVPVEPPTAVHTESELMPPALLNFPGYYNQQITRLNSELDKNKLLEIKKIPQIFSTKLSAITQYTTFESTPENRMPVRIVMPTAYPAHHQINLKTDVLSHNVNINAPPLTFKRENFPLAAAIRGHIAPTHMPQVKIPANRANVEVRLSPLNTRMSVVRDFDKQLKDAKTNQQNIFSKPNDNFDQNSRFADTTYQQMPLNNLKKETIVESKTDWNSQSLIAPFTALPKAIESKNPNYKENALNDLSMSIYEAHPLNKLKKDKTYMPQDQRAEYTQNNLNIIRNQKLTDYLILNKTQNKFDFMRAQPFRVPSLDLNHKTFDLHKNDRPKKLFVATGEHFRHKIEPTENGSMGTMAISQNVQNIDSAFSRKINQTYSKFYTTTTLLTVPKDMVSYESELKTSYANLIKNISSMETDKLKALTSNILIFKTDQASASKSPIAVASKQMKTYTTSTRIKHTPGANKTNSTSKNYRKTMLTSKIQNLLSTSLYLPNLQSELNSSVIAQRSQTKLLNTLPTSRTAIAMSSISAMKPNSNNTNKFHNAIKDSQLYQSVSYVQPALESSEAVLIKAQFSSGELSNDRITDSLDDSTLSTIMQSILCTDNSLSCAVKVKGEQSERTESKSVKSTFILKPSIPISSKTLNANIFKNKTIARGSSDVLADFEHDKSLLSKLNTTLSNLDKILNTNLFKNDTVKIKTDVPNSFAYFEQSNAKSVQSKTMTSAHFLIPTITVAGKILNANALRNKTIAKDTSNISAGYTKDIQSKLITKANILKSTITIDDITLSSKIDTDMTDISNQEHSNATDLDYDSNLEIDKVTRDEQFVPPLNSNSVFLGGVIIAGPSKTEYIENSSISYSTDVSVCYPACKSKLNEFCISLPKIGNTCECRSGFARLFPDRPCKPTYTFELRIPTSRVGNYPLKHNNDYSNNLSSQYRYLSSIVLDAIDRMVMQSDFRDIYYGVQLREFNMDQNEAIIGTFLLQLSENCAEKRLETVFRKYLRQSNFSIGGTELYATRDRLNALTVQDFDECVNSGFNDCSPLAQCFNLAGSYTCSCRDGFTDISDNSLYPGRQCTDQLIGCEKCNYHGNCVVPISNTNNSLEGEDVQHFCECFAWYTGYNCQLNLKILLICLIAIGILFVMLLACMFLIYTSRKNRTRPKFITAFNYHPSTLTTNSIRKCSLEKSAILNDSNSESSHSSEQNLYKDSIDLVQKEHSGNILYKLKQIPIERKHATFDKQLQSLHSLVDQSSHSRMQDNINVEQTDRSLTVMIPRAKYYHPTVLPVLPIRQNLDRIDTLNQSGEATQFYTTLTDKAKEDEWFSKDYRCSNNGALVSAGFEVSAIVNEVPAELKESKKNLESANGRQQITSTSLEAILRSVESTDVRSFDETTIQPATKSFRSCFDMQTTSITNEDVNMTERDMGFTFLLPHTHLYKPEKTKSDLSGFDSV